MPSCHNNKGLCSRMRAIALLAVLVALVAPRPAFASATKSTARTTPVIASSYPFSVKKGVTVYELPDDGRQFGVHVADAEKYRAATATIVSGLECFKTSISLASFKLKPAEANYAYLNAIFGHPALFYAWGGYCTCTNGVVVDLRPTYRYSKSSVATMRSQLDAGVAAALAWAPAQASVEEKLKAVHDYLITTCTYDHVAYNSATTNVPRAQLACNAWSAYARNTSVCWGEALSFNAAAERLGIECAFVSDATEGTTNPHAWSAVKLEGKWFFVDVDQDNDYDTVGNPAQKSTKFLKSYRYFSEQQGYAFNVALGNYDFISLLNNARATSRLSWSDIAVYSDTRYDARTWPVYVGGGLTLSNFARATITLPQGSYAYTGSAITPVPVVTLGSITLKPNSDYRLSYSNNVKAGRATLTVTGQGSFAGKVSTTFTISAAKLAKAVVTLPAASYRYSGSPVKPLPTLKMGSRTLKAGSDYSIAYRNNVQPGVATVVVTGKGNYSGTLTRTFTIVGYTARRKSA